MVIPVQTGNQPEIRYRPERSPAPALNREIPAMMESRIRMRQETGPAALTVPAPAGEIDPDTASNARGRNAECR